MSSITNEDARDYGAKLNESELNESELNEYNNLESNFENDNQKFLDINKNIEDDIDIQRNVEYLSYK